MNSHRAKTVIKINGIPAPLSEKAPAVIPRGIDDISSQFSQGRLIMNLRLVGQPFIQKSAEWRTFTTCQRADHLYLRRPPAGNLECCVPIKKP